MKIEIRNFRGCTLADIEHSKFTLIAGKNHQGKSSIAQAIGAALACRPLVIDILKSQIKNIIRDGAKRAEVKIIFDDAGQVSVAWPEAKHFCNHKSFKPISDIAAGLSFLPDLKKSDRAAALSNILQLEPTEEDLSKELKSFNMPESVIKELIPKIRVNGFDTMYLRAKEAGARIKGQWEELTGTNYGSQIAENWYPPSYYSALSSTDESELKKAISEAEKDVEAGIAAKAINEMELSTWKKQAELKPEIEKYLIMLEKSLEVLRAEEIERQNLLLNLTSEKEFGCPACGQALIFKDDKLIPADPNKKTGDIKEKEKATDNLQKTRNKIRNMLQEIAAKQTELKEATRAEAELKKIEGHSTKISDDDLAEARIKFEKAKMDLKAWTDYRRSLELKEMINQNKIIVDTLAPSGLKNTVANRALSPFNKLLSDLSSAAGWPTVRIDKDYFIYYGDRLSQLCSTEENFEIKTLLQLAYSKLENAYMVIIDGAEIMVSPKDRNGLFMALLAAGIPAVVCMSFKDHADAPDLAAIGGRTYWIENGELKA